MSGYSSIKVRKIVDLLASRFGVITWWSGDTDEVMIGAVLTQQTRWENVEKAISRLKADRLATMAAIHAADVADIEEAVRCTGFFRIKAKRLKGLAALVMDTYGGVAQMAAIPTASSATGFPGPVLLWMPTRTGSCAVPGYRRNNPR